jgi:hypothetical protein
LPYWRYGEWAFRSVFKRNDPYGDAEKQQGKCRYPIRIKRHDISPSRSRRKNDMKFKLRHVPIFGRSAAAQQNMPRCRLMGSHQRFSVVVAKYGATTNVSRPERHSRYRYSFVGVRRSALRRRQIRVKLICSGSWTKYPEAVLRRSRLARGIRLFLIPPSPPTEQATACQNQAGKSCTGDGTGYGQEPPNLPAWEHCGVDV